MMKSIVLMIFSYCYLVTGICAAGEPNPQEKTQSGYKYRDVRLPLDVRIADLVSRLTLEEKISQLMHESAAIPRLNIPYYSWWGEALHGVARSGRATVFPQAIGMAATFDEDLIFRAASAISDEARVKFNAAQQIGNEGRNISLTFWSPNINIFRDPRWGRGQETYGEDPYLTGVLASAFVRGLQGDHPRYLKAAACAKHYAVHSGPEGERHSFNARPPLKDFYETYLPAFEMLVREAGVQGVMCAYNRTYDEPCCGSPLLIQDILRKRWKFDGYLVSDCWAIVDFNQGHQVTARLAESAAKALKTGVNLNCGNEYEALGEAVKLGLISVKDIDKNLIQLLRTRFKLGLFDPPEMNLFNKISPEVLHSPEHIELAREAARKSVVLLKNANHTLPLRKDIKFLAVVGPNATSNDVLLGNYHGVSDQLVSVLEGVTAKVNAGTVVQYRQGFLPDQYHPNTVDWAVGEARSADACIIVMGITPLMEGEEGEALASTSKGDRAEINLPANQIEYLKKVRADNPKPVIVVLTGGSPVAIPEVHELADAVLYAWYPGEQGGNGVADIIFGDYNPSGRLPVTFPKSIGQLPPFEDYAMANRTYRYMRDEPQYPFGFGLSFTKFGYSGISAASRVKKGQDTEISITITNTGNQAGDEVVQLYISALDSKLDVPLHSLKGIKRITLEAGHRTEVSFKITPEMLSLFNDKGEKVLEKGHYRISVGGSSPGKRSLELGAAEMAETVISVF
jgi:beta-glucosidase